MPLYGPGTVEDGTTSVSTQLALMLSQLIDNLSQGEYTPADESVTTEKLAADVIAALAAKADDVDLAALEAALTAALAGKQDTIESGTYADNPTPGTARTAVVADAVAQTIAGVKTFSSTPVVPDASFAAAKVIGLAADLADAGRLFSRLARGIANTSWLVLGDSTGDANDEWVYLTGVALAARYPAYTVRYNLWNSGSGTWNAATTIATGSGSQFLDIWNASVAGLGTAYFLAPYFETMIASKQPDLVTISLGHNEGTSDPGGITEAHWRGQYLALTELVAQACPDAGIVIVAQNPQSANTDQARRATVYEGIASTRGYGFIDVHQAFVNTGNVAAHLNVDGIHPNSLGSALWRDTVLAAFATAPRGRRRTQPASALDQVGDQQLVNGDFTDFKVSPAGWVLSGCTVTKDSTRYRSKKEYSARIRATGAVQSFIRKDLSPLQMYVGQWVTVVVWMFVPTGQTGNAGRIALSDGVESIVSRGPGPSNGWVPQVLTKRIVAGASYVRITIYGDSGAVSTADINVDTVDVTVGAMPRKAVIPGALPLPANMVALDTFNRADSTTTLGSTEAVPGYSALPWMAVSGVSGITGRKMYRVSGSVITTIDPSIVDHAVEDTITFHASAATKSQGIVIRYIDASNFLLAALRNAEITFYKQDAGVYTVLGTFAIAPVPGQDYLLRFQCQGSAVKVLLDEVERITYTLTAGEVTKYGSATKVGIWEQSSSNGGLHDNFTVYKL